MSQRAVMSQAPHEPAMSQGANKDHGACKELREPAMIQGISKVPGRQ